MLEQRSITKRMQILFFFFFGVWLVLIESLRRELELAIKIRKNSEESSFLHFKCVKVSGDSSIWD